MLRTNFFFYFFVATFLFEKEIHTQVRKKNLLIYLKTCVLVRGLSIESVKRKVWFSITFTCSRLLYMQPGLEMHLVISQWPIMLHPCQMFLVLLSFLLLLGLA